MTVKSLQFLAHNKKELQAILDRCPAGAHQAPGMESANNGSVLTWT